MRYEERIAQRIMESGRRRQTPPPLTCAGTPVGQSDFPLAPVSGTTYCLTENVTVATGTAVNFTGRTNAKLDLNGFTLTFSTTGNCIWVNFTNAVSCEILSSEPGGRIVKGPWSAGGATTNQSVWAGSNLCKVYGSQPGYLTLEFKNLGGTRAFFEVFASRNAELYNCTIDFEADANSGNANLAYVFNSPFHDNVVNIHDTNGNGPYARVFEDINSGLMYNNVFNVEPGTQPINLVTSFSLSNTVFRDNTVNWNTNNPSSERILNIDANSKNWQVYRNRFTLTGESGSNLVCIRMRIACPYTGAPPENSGHLIYNNTFDSIGLQGAESAYAALSFGDGCGPTRNIDVYNNEFIGKGRFIEYYGGVVDGINVFCNQVTHQGTGTQAVTVANRNIPEFDLSNNVWTSPQSVVCQNNRLSADLDWCKDTFNGNAMSAAYISGDTSGMLFTTGACPNGDGGCGSIGA